MRPQTNTFLKQAEGEAAVHNCKNVQFKTGPVNGKFKIVELLAIFVSAGNGLKGGRSICS